MNDSGISVQYIWRSQYNDVFLLTSELLLDAVHDSLLGAEACVADGAYHSLVPGDP